ncbi:hypothetical protein JHD44_03000 [Marinomonas ostreistagni]|uniref:VanZ-like domain-containing protein n=2 Tax=Marinomonas ostreistagni TaxID=359209 RepID=A0ABS0Z8V0_9GAMM|nr:hypothetical protein [Marinomonas ostreistagni]
MKWSWLFDSRTQWLGFALGALIVLLGTLMPASSLGSPPGSDKLHHILGFSFWAGLCAWGPSKRFYAFACLIVICGGMIELIQPYVNRIADWKDFIANTVGVSIACFLHLTLTFFKKRGTDTA